MNELTKTQVVMLVLLVSFVTSLVTGIVTVTLVNQAPPPVTQTINRVIEKTIQTIVPGEPKQNTPAAPIIITQEDLIVKVVRDVSPAVVSIVATKDLPIIEEYFINPFVGNKFFDSLPDGALPDIKIRQYRQNGTEKKRVSSGTGFFVSSDGMILTNKHVVEDKDAAYSIIMNDGNKFEIEVLARDPIQDIAILKIILPEENDKKEFKFIPLDNSNSIRIGQSVIAIGNALGEFQNTVSVGIISGLNRSVTASGPVAGPEELTEMIQTDASINPGNSGGPLLDLAGRAVGINTAVALSAENVGFALLARIAQRDIEDVKEFGEIKYPFMGIRYQSLDAEAQKEKELTVGYGFLLIPGPNGEDAVIKDGPADKAGMMEGDIVLEINNKKINRSVSLSVILSKLRVGDNVNLKVLRGGEKIDLTLELEEKP